MCNKYKIIIQRMRTYPSHSLRNNITMIFEAQWVFLSNPIFSFPRGSHSTECVSFSCISSALTTIAVSVAGPPHNALERMHRKFLGLFCRSGAAQGWLSSDLQPPNKIVLSAVNFKLYLDGIVPYVLICSLLYTAQCTLLRVSHQMLMAVVHLFSLCTVPCGTNVPVSMHSLIFGHLAWFWGFAIIQHCYKHFVDISQSICTQVLPLNPRKGMPVSWEYITSILLDNARLLAHSSRWFFSEHPCQNLILSDLGNSANPMGVKWHLIVVFIWIFLINHELNIFSYFH